MAVQLNHTIVWSSDQTKSARFLTAILGLPAPIRSGHFDVVKLGNGAALDFARLEGPIQSQHYAFLIGETDFDAIFGRIQEEGPFWADPMCRRLGEINRDDDGWGVYFFAPDSHLLEVITRPYSG